MSSPKKLKTENDRELQEFIDATNESYEKLHLDYENQFWGTKMNLAGDTYSTEKLSSTKEAMEAFLRDPGRLAEVEKMISSNRGSDLQKVALNCFSRTFKCYQMSDPEAVALRTQCTSIEDALNSARNKTFALGYTPPGGTFTELSSVQLRTLLRTSQDEGERKAAWEGLRSIGPFVLSTGLCEMVKLRNSMAIKLGYEDFYDYKVTQAEGFGKKKLFDILDTLKNGSDPLLEKARAQLSADKGPSSLEAWNTGFMMAGDVETALDPYFPFEKSLEVWGKCFSNLGINYQGATMTLDLLERKGKYSNGFCHWPQPAWRKGDGTWQPSTTNFTSLADPSAVGSGKTALVTLMHEAGHAAHFANIDMCSPLFSQERAPTSVAYAENQSMFLDSLVGDAAWRGRYAKDREGNPLPWALHKQAIEATHPYSVFTLRAMIAVPYFEKALYELKDDEINPETIQALADRIEHEIQGGFAARPLLSVPHIISDEASCYYHGYVLAEMSVYQTREYFLNRGSIVDNKAVGEALTRSYWRPGNSEMFLDLVHKLTGKPLSGDPWIEALNENLETLLAKEEKEYTAALAAPPIDEEVNLNMRVLIKDGDELIADSDQDGGFMGVCKTFEAFVNKRFPK